MRKTKRSDQLKVLISLENSEDPTISISRTSSFPSKTKFSDKLVAIFFWAQMVALFGFVVLGMLSYVKDPLIQVKDKELQRGVTFDKILVGKMIDAKDSVRSFLFSVDSLMPDSHKIELFQEIPATTATRAVTEEKEGTTLNIFSDVFLPSIQIYGQAWLCSTFSALFGLFYMLMVHINPALVIYTNILLSSSFLLFIGIFMFGYQNGFYSIIGAFLTAFGALQLLIFYVWRRRLLLTFSLLRTATLLIHSYRGLLTVTILTSLGYSFVWALWIIGTLIVEFSYPNVYAHAIVMFLLTFSFFWTSQVAKNVLHTTTAGVIGMWYFHHQTPALFPKNVVFDALRRCTTLSLGALSCCSLLTGATAMLCALITRLYTINFFGTGLCTILGSFTRIFDLTWSFFNRYVLISIGIEGGSYAIAMSRTILMLKDCALAAFVNDIFLCQLTQMGGVYGGIVSSSVMVIIKQTFDMNDYSVWLAFLGGYIACRLVILLMSVCVDSIFFCYYLKPNGLDLSIPNLASILQREFVASSWRI